MSKNNDSMKAFKKARKAAAAQNISAKATREGSFSSSGEAARAEFSWAEEGNSHSSGSPG